jgi:hypothetical protein
MEIVMFILLGSIVFGTAGLMIYRGIRGLRQERQWMATGEMTDEEAEDYAFECQEARAEEAYYDGLIESGRLDPETGELR